MLATGQERVNITLSKKTVYSITKLEKPQDVMTNVLFY